MKWDMMAFITNIDLKDFVWSTGVKCFESGEKAVHLINTVGVLEIIQQLNKSSQNNYFTDYFWFFLPSNNISQVWNFLFSIHVTFWMNLFFQIFLGGIWSENLIENKSHKSNFKHIPSRTFFYHSWHAQTSRGVHITWLSYSRGQLNKM
jgi:hypothetical protein